MIVATHTLPTADFDALAVGGGDTATIAVLRTGQLSKHILQIRAVLDAASSARPRSDRPSKAYGLLSSVQRTHPRDVETVLLHPYVGAWGVHCLERLYGLNDVGTSLDADLGYLATVAAAAAIRAGVAFEINVPVRDGRVLLPGFGVAAVPSGASDEATVRSDGSVTQVVAADGTRTVVPAEPHRDAPGWTGLRRLHARCVTRTWPTGWPTMRCGSGAGCSRRGGLCWSATTGPMRRPWGPAYGRSPRRYRRSPGRA